MREEKRKNPKITTEKILVSTFLFLTILTLSALVAATPTGPSSINVTANESKALTGGQEVNISGGIISKINITASVQNPGPPTRKTLLPLPPYLHPLHRNATAP